MLANTGFCTLPTDLSDSECESTKFSVSPPLFIQSRALNLEGTGEQVTDGGGAGRRTMRVASLRRLWGVSDQTVGEGDGRLRWFRGNRTDGECQYVISELGQKAYCR